MSDSPYIPFYTSDFLGGTSGMTAATKGVYITLLCLMYEQESPLKQSWDTLARRSGCTLPTFKKIIESLADDQKVIVSDAGIWSEKCEKHLAQRRERQRGAKAAAKKRWEKSKQKQGKADATACNPQCQPEPDIKEEGKPSSKNKRGSRLPEDWVLPKDWGDWALSKNWSETVIRFESEKFRDYWHSVAGQKGVKLNWEATWRNWMRNSSSPKTISGGRNDSSSKSQDRLHAFVSGARGAP